MTGHNRQTPETLLQRKLRLFKESLIHLVNVCLDRIFDLKPDSARLRTLYLIFLLFLSGLLISSRIENYSISRWVFHVQDIFLFLFNPIYAERYIGDPFTKFILFLWPALTNPYTLQYLPIFLVPFFIALHYATCYLTDIFELENINIARKFLLQIALMGSKETIRITNGEVSAEHINSPLHKIGGPGKVIIDLDTVALFERPDCTPNIIGPTGDMPGGKATLVGFERLRNTIDLRDHHSESLIVSSRSLDGIKIGAIDVRVIYSIFRNNQADQELSKQQPYPFSIEAVKKLVYGSASKITETTKLSSSVSSPILLWLPSILRLVKGELGFIMSGHNLTEYLASFGEPEFEKAKARETIIEAQAEQMRPPHEPKPIRPPISPPPKFTPRNEISKLFSQLEQEFRKKCAESGVAIHWVGVGTWETPIEIVTEKHLEAWRLSRENMARSSEDEFKNFEEETIQLKMITLIQDVPLGKYQTLTSAYDHKNAMRALLLAYGQQLIEAADFLHAKGEAVPQIIIQAIDYISDILGYKNWHWVG